MAVKIFWDNGVTIERKGEILHLDASPKLKGNVVLVSHAHGDHVGGLKAKGRIAGYATEATLKIFEAAFGKKPAIPVKPVKYGEKFKVGCFKVKVFNSGHIFGSCGFLVEIDGLTIAYTGDLNFSDSLLTKAAEPVECDILIIESTYGSPQYRFPSRGSLYPRMVKWAVEKVKEGKIPVFHVYPVGKAQEIVRMLNEYTDLQVYVHPKIAKVNSAHESLGFKLDAEPLKGKPKPGSCVLVQPRSLLGYLNLEKVSPAVATGWAVRYRWMGVEAFPLSNHADFPQLLSYVKQVKPRKVYTCYGFSDMLASALKTKLGLKAEPLPAGNPPQLIKL